MSKRIIGVLSTGGTIDKVYGRGKGVRDLHIGEPCAPDILRRFASGLTVSFLFQTLMKKDSLDMKLHEREQTRLACERMRADSIIITHGTDTLLKTAEHLANAISLRKRLIVLTGALQPSCVKESDAEFNLGMAFATALRNDITGVYVAINAVYRWDECKKSVSGAFVYKQQEKGLANEGH